MSWKYTDEYYKNYTRDTWDECAQQYLPVMQQLKPFHKALVSQLNPVVGESILDVCTGPGEPALTIAEIVAPTGSVIGLDLSRNMTEMATKTAERRQLSNVKFLNMDAEKLDLGSDAFDAVVSCFGFQIVTNPEAAAQEILRVLKPGGRAAFTVWSTGDRSPALDVIVGPMLEHATPDEDGYIPSPYELGGPDELATMLRNLGFTNTREVRVVDDWRAESSEDFLNMILSGTPIGHSLSEEEKDVQQKILEKTRANITHYSTTNGVKIPAECVMVFAKKPTF